MIRATVLSVIDQALLSLANFGLALVLIRYGSQQEYGLYTQLLGLQSLFSVLHAALFVSAYLSLLPRLEGAARRSYQAGMARAEFGITLLSALLVAVLTWAVASLIGHALAWATSAAAALTLLGLWWREFSRARYFAEGGVLRVLRLDAAYLLLIMAGIAALIVGGGTSATTVLWCTGVAGVAVALVPIARQARLARIEAGSVREKLGSSWLAARWEIMTSLVTWGHAQSFVYFAAAQGGLTAAAEISAARLITMPLALVWLSYSQILRPEASRLLGSPDALSGLRRLAGRSALFALSLAVAYGAVLLLALPLVERYLFAGQFQHLRPLSLLWLLYFALTGMTTIATSLLRSALEFKALFRIHATCAALAVAAFCAGLAAHTPTIFVIVLVVMEAVLSLACWRRLRWHLQGHTPANLALGGAQRA